MRSNDDFLATVTQPYRSWSDSKLATESVKIKTAINGNTYFPDTTPSAADYSTAVDTYLDLLGKATGTREVNAVDQKNIMRRELIALTVTLGTSCSLAAGGDVEMLRSTALPLRKRAQTRILGKPANFRCTNGINPGELLLKVDTMVGVVSFSFTYTEYPPTETSTWTTVTSSKSTCTLTGLTAGKRYWIRVAAIGTKGQMVWGETIQSPYVQ
jgi:hypothetical protein